VSTPPKPLLSALLASLTLAFGLRVAAGPPQERVDQAWKVQSLAEKAGLVRANLFNLDFEKTGDGRRKGTAWIASSDGLHEFDGYTWRRHGKAQGLPSDFVRAVHITRAGDLWVGTDRGAGIYDGKSYRSFGSETNLAGPNVRRIEEDNEGTLWFCSDSWPEAGSTGGLTSFRDGRWRTYHPSDGLPSEYVVNFLRDSAGNEFAATLSGLAHRQGDRWHTLLEPASTAETDWGSSCLAEIPGLGVVMSTGTDLYFRTGNRWIEHRNVQRHLYGICASRDGRLFASGISASGHGSIVEWRNQQWETVSSAYALPNGYTEDIREAPDGSIWVAGFGCLIRWAREASELHEYPGVPPPRLVDSEGTVWFAENRGIDRAPSPAVRNRKWNWNPLPIAYEQLVSDPRRGDVWGWTSNQVGRFRGTNETHFLPAQTGLSNVVQGLFDRAGRFWIVGHGPEGEPGAAVLEQETWTHIRPPELRGLEVWRRTVSPATSGIWIGGDRGPGSAAELFHLSDKPLERIPLPSDLFKRQRVEIQADRRGDLWAYNDSGLYRWDAAPGQGWKRINELPGRHVIGCVERGDELWFGCTEGTGGDGALARLRNGTWSLFHAEISGNLRLENDGSLTCGGFGRFWKIANHPDAVPVVVNLPTSERVTDLAKDLDGSYWLNFGNGAAHFQADGIPAETQVTGAPHVIRGDLLTAEATAIERFLPESVGDDHLFSWRQDDGAWSPPSPTRVRSIDTGKMAYGLHRLEVRCVSGTEEVDPTPALLEFTVGSRPIQDRAWFIPSMSGLALIMTSLALVALRARTGLAELVESLEDKVSQRTADLELELRRRRQIEEELRFNEAILRETGEIAKVGGWTFDVATGAGYWTAEVARIHEVDPNLPATRDEGLRYYSGEHRTRIEEAIQRAIHRGEPYDLELELTSASGTRKWVRTIGRPVFQGDRVVRLRGSFQDITERKEAEKGLQERLRLQGRLSTVAASVPGALFSFQVRDDGTAYFPEASPRFLEILGVRPEELEKDAGPAFAQVHPGDLERVLAQVALVVRDRLPWHDIFRVLHPAKGLVWIEGSSHPTTSETGQPIWHGILLDITERRRMEIRHETEHAVARVLAEAASLDAATPAVLRALCEGEGWQHGELWTLDETGGRLICRQTWNSGGPEFETLNTQTRAMSFTPGEGLIGRTLAAGELIRIPSLGEDPGFLRKSAVAAAGLRSAVAFPIRTADRITGVMAFMGSQPAVSDPTLETILTTLGTQVGQFLSRKTVEEELRRFLALSPATLYALRIAPGQPICYWVSENVVTLTGYTAGEAVQKSWWTNHLHPDDREKALATDGQYDASDRQLQEYRFRRKDGSYFWIRDEKRLLRSADGLPNEVVGAWTNITERRTLEEQLRQAQKMEAIGQLSGGIAHDFNNILGAIIGNAQLGGMEAPKDQPAAGHFAEILKASQRAANLVRQILTFARQDSHQKHSIELGPVVEETVGMLRATIPAGVDVSSSIAPGLPTVVADGTQIQQVLLNLGTNAWHALQGGSGRIRIELEPVEVDAVLARKSPDLQPGPYVRLRVRDTGIGMDAAILERIFEPFFTTKAPGQGTGLGLSVVHGIVQSHRGAITVESSPDQGTVFEIYLPASGGTRAPGPSPESRPKRGSGERLLLVDDEVPLLRITTKVLERLGYQVTACVGSSPGLERFLAEPDAFALMLCDLNMPEKSGLELAQECLGVRPSLPVLLTSGVLSEEVRQSALAAGIRGVVKKPASIEELSSAIRRCLHPEA
jgi:PAS domain S-box-containing protein